MASAPDAVQAMLKTSTEIGDFGRFAVKPSRIPHPIAGASSRKADIILGPMKQHGYRSNRRFSREQDPLEGRQGSSSTSTDQTTSRSVSTLGGDHSTSSPSTPHNIKNHTYRSYSLTQNSHNPYTLSNHRSYASLKSNGDVPFSRPRSPFAYPTRLKRPGFRPSSPALNEYNSSDPRATFGFHRAPSFRTPSPSSLYAQMRVPHGYGPDFSQSSPLLPIPPSPNMRFRYGETRMQPLPGRMPRYIYTPGSDRLAAPDGSLGSEATTIQPQPPRYYDYTEAFEEQEIHHSASISVISLPLVDQTIPEDRLPSVRYEPHEPQVVKAEIAKVPAADVSEPSEDSVSLPRSSHATHIDDSKETGCAREPARAFSGDSSTLQYNDEEVPPENHSLDFKDQLRDATIPRTGSTGTTVQQDFNFHIVPRSRNFSSSSTSSNAENLGISSSLISLYHPSALMESPKLPSKANQEGIRDPSPVLLGSSEASRPQNWKIPSLDFSLMDLAGQTEKSPEEPRESSRVSGGPADLKGPIIHAPIPRRSLSSQSQRHRFSKILSVEEGLAGLTDTICTTEEPAEGSSTSDRYPSESSKTHESATRRPTSRLSVRSLKRLMRLGTVGERDATDVDDPSAPEALRIQTKRTPNRLVRRPRPETESNTLTIDGNSVLVDAISLVHTISRESSGWRLAAETPTREVSDSQDVDATQPSPGLLSTRGNNDSASAASNDHSSLLRNTSFRSFTPPTPVVPTILPYSFVPLTAEGPQASNAAALEPAVVLDRDTTLVAENDDRLSPPRYKVRIRVNRVSTTSPPDDRPWNVEESYPWMDRHPSVDVHIPEPVIHRQQPREKTPKFKLKVSRAAKTTHGALNDDKHAALNNSEPPKITGSPSGHFRSCHPARRNRIGTRLGSTRTSTSSDSLPAPSLTIGAPSYRPNTSGTANLVLLSPALNSADERSFFSDDSSQVQQKGSIRKRLSEFKAKLPASRGTSTDEGRAADRILSRSAMNRSRASGRTSNKSEDGTAGVSNIKNARHKVMQKLKGWWQQSSGKVKGYGGKFTARDTQGHSRTTDLYSGV